MSKVLNTEVSEELQKVDGAFNKLKDHIDQIRFTNINEDEDMDSIEDKLYSVESDIESLRKSLGKIQSLVRKLKVQEPIDTEFLDAVTQKFNNVQITYRKTEFLMQSGKIFSSGRLLDVLEFVSSDLDTILRLIDPKLLKTSQIAIDTTDLEEDLSLSTEDVQSSSSEDLESSAEQFSAEESVDNKQLMARQMTDKIAESSALISEIEALIKSVEKSEFTNLAALDILNKKIMPLLDANSENNKVLNNYYAINESNPNINNMSKILNQLNHNIAELCSDTIPDLMHKAKQKPMKNSKVESVIKASVKRLSAKLSRGSKTWVDDSQGKLSAEKARLSGIVNPEKLTKPPKRGN